MYGPLSCAANFLLVFCNFIIISNLPNTYCCVACTISWSQYIIHAYISEMETYLFVIRPKFILDNLARNSAVCFLVFMSILYVYVQPICMCHGQGRGIKVKSAFMGAENCVQQSV